MSINALSKLNQTFVLLFALLLLTFRVNGQGGKIVLIDSKSKETIPFAHVCFEELNSNYKQYTISNKDGIVTNPCKTKALVVISFVGYKTYIDTIQPSKSYEITLLPQVFDIDQVVVTASFTPQKADKSIYNVKVIDARKIEQRAATNLSDILKDEVNIQVTHDPSLGSGLRLKGLSGNNVKILVDGVPVIGRMGGNIDLAQLSLYNIDHIEVVEGPMSVVYGSNALAGAINIISKENLHSSQTITANSYYENVGTYKFDGIFSYKKGYNSFSFSGGRNFFSGVYLDVDKNRSQQWKPKEQYNADFYYTFNKSSHKLKFQSSLMNERLLDKGDQLAPSYRNAQDSWFHSLRFTNRLEYTLKLKNSYFINMLGSHSVFQRKKLTYLKDFIDSSSKLIEDNTSNDTSLFNALSYKVLFGNQNAEKKFNFLTGLDFNYEQASGKRILDEKQVIGDYAFFTSIMYNVSKKLSIQPGFRLAINTRFDVPPVPSLNFKWNALSFLNIRASYTRGYRAPTLKELYILFKDINHDIQPNENLKAEYGHNFDFSFNFNTDKADKIHFSNIDVNLFYNRMSNIIYLAPYSTSTPSGVYKYINISRFNTLGGQVSFKYSFYPRFDFGLGVGQTGTLASFNDNNQGISHYKFAPEANLNMSYLLPKYDIKISTSYKYTGSTWMFNVLDNNTIESGKLDDYHNLDLSLIRKFFSNKITLTLGVKNIFDNTIVNSTGRVSGTAHTGANGSPIGYGRIYFTSLSYNIYK